MTSFDTVANRLVIWRAWVRASTEFRAHLLRSPLLSILYWWCKVIG